VREMKMPTVASRLLVLTALQARRRLLLDCGNSGPAVHTALDWKLRVSATEEAACCTDVARKLGRSTNLIEALALQLVMCLLAG